MTCNSFLCLTHARVCGPCPDSLKACSVELFATSNVNKFENAIVSKMRPFRNY